MLRAPGVFFFYGTLIDADVLDAVVRRPIPRAARRPADVHGWRRVVRAGASYPLLLPEENGRIDGVLVSGLGATDVARLIRFEGGDYALGEVLVRPRGGVVVRARVFLPHAGVPATAEAWSLAVWQRRHKRRYLAHLRRCGIAD